MHQEMLSRSASTIANTTASIRMSIIPRSRCLQRRYRERSILIRFDQFDGLVTATSPTVAIAAVNVNCGAFERYSDANITPETTVASEAVPRPFDPVELDGDRHWGGFSRRTRLSDGS